ncbi:MAG: PQQ-like beta-propeller repeat protein, partial [Polyangiaceae bacterium]|nr:PQQ-like beta-propeller repeat protein [Polyangiaceae bacterium]
GSRIIAQPVLAGRRVYVGSFSGTIHALDARGRELWKRDLGGPIYSTPYIAPDGTLYVGTDAGYLYALDSSGEIRFRLATEAEADTGVVPAPGRDGLLHFAAGKDLWAITRDGRVRWRFRARSKIFTTPAIDEDGTIYVGSQDDHLYAIAPDGDLRWAFEANGDIDSSPVIGDDGTIYFGCDDRRLYALDRDGRLKFKVQLGGFVRAPAALGPNGTVLVGVFGPRPRLVALGAADGAERWSFAVTVSESNDLGVSSGPLVDREGRIYFGAHDNYLYALTPEGQLLWTFGAEGDIDTPPVLGRDGVLYFGSDDGRLYAISEP